MGMGNSCEVWDGSESARDDALRTRSMRDLSVENISVTSSAKFLVECPSCGHEMFATIPRELHLSKLLHCASGSSCDSCGIDPDDGELTYRCPDCYFQICVRCSREQLGLPAAQYEIGRDIAQVLPGDIMLAYGDERLVIHHAMLVQGPLVYEPLEAVDRCNFDFEPGTELWGCDTIESSGSVRGQDTWWHPCMTLFARNQYQGTAFIVGSILQDGTLQLNTSPTPFKILFHPLRKTLGGPGVDTQIFKKVVNEASEQSQKWTWNAGLARSVLMGKGVMKQNKYNTEAKREYMLSKLERNWDKPCVCSGLPVQCWQRYFVAAYGRDDAAQMIIQYMPLKGSKAAPSQLVIELTKRGWALSSNLEP